MPRFSERFGLVSAKRTIQMDSVDDALRTGLWNALTNNQFADTVTDPLYGIAYPAEELKALCQSLWLDFFKRPIDTLPRRWKDIAEQLKEFFFNAQWYEVYDFIEFCAQAFPHAGLAHQYMDECNLIMERELSAYRFVSGRIVPITDESEIAAIEEARQLPRKLSVVGQHLAAALSLLSDRKTPDYRNSIKESISAVEGMCSLIAGQDKADLSAALRTIEKTIGLHGALKAAFNSLYGYSSDANGIRHALLDESNLTFDDAKFMLVTCSAFVNYLKGAAARAGLQL